MLSLMLLFGILFVNLLGPAGEEEMEVVAALVPLGAQLLAPLLLQLLQTRPPPLVSLLPSWLIKELE